MSIEKNLGVESIDTPLMVSARTAWSRWVAVDPTLGVVADLADLQRWWRNEAPEVRDAVLARLAALASHDFDAAVALAWMLVPGAKGVGGRLRDLSTDIDGAVASQLWMEIRGSEPPQSYVAKTILRNVENAIKAEHGVGDAGERADRVWSVASVEDVADVPAPDDDPDASLSCSASFAYSSSTSLTSASCPSRTLTFYSRQRTMPTGWASPCAAAQV